MSGSLIERMLELQYNGYKFDPFLINFNFLKKLPISSNFQMKYLTRNYKLESIFVMNII